MHADPKGVLTGIHFIDGDHAACEGALAAGCRFVAGYPITPSTEVVERFAARIPLVGGMFIQMEDELASSIAIQGAVWAGKKVMTVTSGPGLSLMMEHVGLAAFHALDRLDELFVGAQRNRRLKLRVRHAGVDTVFPAKAATRHGRGQARECFSLCR